MKLKYLIKLNAILILCSIAIDTMAKESLTLETRFDAPKPYSVKKVDNKELKQVQAKKKKISSYKKCEIKTGVINQIVRKDSKKRELTLQPVYYQLNPQSFNLYDTLGNKAQLISVLNIDKVVRLLEIYPGTHCITFVVRMENKKEDEPLTVCADNVKQKDNFSRMITEFKECDIHVMSSEVNEQVLMDFSKVNYLLTPQNRTVTPGLKKIIAAIPGAKAAASARSYGKRGLPGTPGYRGGPAAAGQRTPEEEKDLLDGMYYDNSQKTIRKKPQAVLRTQQMKKHVKSIITEIQMGNLAQKKLQREYQGKIAQAERVAKEVEHQKEIVREILQKRSEKEQERKVVMQQKKDRNKEMQLMKAVKMQIHKIKVDEIKETKQALRKQLNFIKGIPDDKPKGNGYYGVPTKPGMPASMARVSVAGTTRSGVIIPGGKRFGAAGSINAITRNAVTAASSVVNALSLDEDAGTFAGTLPAGVSSPLSRALIAKYGPLGDNKLVALANSAKGYTQLAEAAALGHAGMALGKGDIKALKALNAMNNATTPAQIKRAKERLAALKQIKKVSTLVKVSSKAMKRVGAKGSSKGSSSGSGKGEKGKYRAMVSLAGRNTNFAAFANVPGGIPKDTTEFTATGVPLKVDKKSGKVILLTSSNPDSPNKLLDYGRCVEKDRLFGKYISKNNFLIY